MFDVKEEFSELDRLIWEVYDDLRRARPLPSFDRFAERLEIAINKLRHIRDWVIDLVPSKADEAWVLWWQMEPGAHGATRGQEAVGALVGLVESAFHAGFQARCERHREPTEEMTTCQK